MALQFRRGLEADLPDPSDAAIGEPLFTTDSGKLFIKKASGAFGQISGSSTWGSITGTLALQTDLNSALGGKVNLADLPQDGSGNLDIAQESTLQALAGRTLTAGTGLTGGGDLTADRTFSVNFGTTATTVAAGNHTHAADTLTTTAQATGYLKWTWSGSTGAWSVADAVAAAPTFINGGNANADDPGS